MLHVVLRDNPSTAACLLSVDVPACRSALRISSILHRCRTFMLDRSSTGPRCNDSLRAGCAGELRTSIVMWRVYCRMYPLTDFERTSWLTLRLDPNAARPATGDGDPVKAVSTHTLTGIPGKPKILTSFLEDILVVLLLRRTPKSNFRQKTRCCL